MYVGTDSSRSAASSVESVFSGTGKFTEEARSAGDKLIGLMARAHYGWNIDILRPEVGEIVKKYNVKHHKSPEDEETHM